MGVVPVNKVLDIIVRMSVFRCAYMLACKHGSESLSENVCARRRVYDFEYEYECMCCTCVCFCLCVCISLDYYSFFQVHLFLSLFTSPSSSNSYPFLFISPGHHHLNPTTITTTPLLLFSL